MFGVLKIIRDYKRLFKCLASIYCFLYKLFYIIYFFFAPKYSVADKLAWKGDLIILIGLWIRKVHIPKASRDTKLRNVLFAVSLHIVNVVQ